MKINFATILGANGNMGSSCGGLIAAFGNVKVFMVSRSIKKANEGIEKAIESVKSDAIRDNFIPKTYDDLAGCISKSDWILEACSEDMAVKRLVNKQISKFVQPRTIISTTTSSFSISTLAADFDPYLQKYYFGTHFFNPPYKMLLCEIIPNPNSDIEVQKNLIEYLEKVLLRQVVVSQDSVAFIANRIAFVILNETIAYGQKYGIEYIDFLLGGISGRVMPPLKTIDLIGLDVYKEVIEHMGLELPSCISKLISQGKLGNKTGSGLYKSTKNGYSVPKQFNTGMIRQLIEGIKEGKYKEVISIIISSNTKEAEIVQYFFARYIQVSFSLIGSAVQGIQEIDKAMAFGFNWLPPGALVELIGGKLSTIKLLIKFNLSVPKEFLKYTNGVTFYSRQNTLDYRTFLRTI